MAWKNAESQRKWRLANPYYDRDWARKYRETHPERQSEIAKTYRRNHPDRNRLTQQKYKRDNPEKSKAHLAVLSAKRNGKLMKMNCVVCNNPAAQAHHEDYSKPFEVIWLCAVHHKHRHRKE